MSSLSLPVTLNPEAFLCPPPPNREAIWETSVSPWVRRDPLMPPLKSSVRRMANLLFLTAVR